MKVKSESQVTQSRPTLSNPMDGSLPGSIQQTEAEPKLEQGDQLGGYENNAEPTEQ